MFLKTFDFISVETFTSLTHIESVKQLIVTASTARNLLRDRLLGYAISKQCVHIMESHTLNLY